MEDIVSFASFGSFDFTSTGIKSSRDMPSGILPDAFFLNRTGEDPSSLPEFLDGSIYIQDLSSQIAVAAADIRPGDDVLDLCAAPGGTSLLASERAGRDGSVLSRDLTEEKTARIRENTVRCRRDNICVETADARIFDPALEERFDVVIADLPCSGFGVIRRKPDIRYKSPEDAADLPEAVLHKAFRGVLCPAAEAALAGGVSAVRRDRAVALRGDRLVEFTAQIV